MKLFGKITNAGVAETLKEGTKLIDEIFTTQEEKLQGKMELFKMAVTDRDSARDMCIPRTVGCKKPLPFSFWWLGVG